MKSHLWSKIKSSGSAFAANKNAPVHRSARKAYMGDAAKKK